MATLARPRPAEAQVQNHTHSLINAHIPSPFPTHILEQERRQQNTRGDISREEPDVDPFSDQTDERREEESVIGLSVESAESESTPSQTGSQEGECLSETELVPTLGYVQQSCIMALNNLLSGLYDATPNWQPILPPRRHSMPSRPESATTNELSSALQTLLENLRKSDRNRTSEASTSSVDDTVLIGELQRRVEAMSHELSPLDSQLSRGLISLLVHVNRLATIDPKLSNARMANVTSGETVGSRSHMDIYDQLSRHLLILQHQRLDCAAGTLVQNGTPQRKVEIALLWSKIDQELETVSSLCRQRNEPAPSPYPDVLPPEYDAYYHADDESLLPPEYEYPDGPQQEKEKGPSHSHQHQQTSDASNEKMRMDLDAVTMAIDRLYLVAPQLHNQRVELRKSKVDELERARLSGKGKEREKDTRELEKLLDLVSKASSRRMNDQSVELDHDMKTRLESSEQRDKARRDAFVEHLLTHSHSRRIDSQDATFQSEEIKDGDALLSLPEFIRERVPEEFQQEFERDPDALLTLSEIVKEPPPPPKAPKAAPSLESLKASKKHFKALTKRSRSLSAPPLAWLIPSLSRSSSSSRLSQAATDSATPVKRLTVRYVAEHLENLNRVVVFVGVDEGLTMGFDLEAEVIPGVGDPTLGDKLVLKSGSNYSAPLGLPLPVPAGKSIVQVQGGHYEIKISYRNSTSTPVSHPSSSSVSRCSSSPTSLSSGSPNQRDVFENGDGNIHSGLLDAEQVSQLDPTFFICASCSSTMVQSQTHSSSQPTEKLTYLDLPSEHWAELLESWMCHTDQRLTERVARHTRGFWPEAGQVFVGGSYFIFHESSVNSSNLTILESAKGDEWRRVQCICGAIVGRYRAPSTDSEGSGSVYRIPKYAIRPVSQTYEPLRVPFAAFILEDMMEFVRAHATYHFVILDEEEERPRILIRIFNPRIRLSYATTAQYALPRTGTVNASKVQFKILRAGLENGVSTPIRSPPGSPHSQLNLESILQRHPGFPQAERLLYPRDVCQRLASLLKESNTAYPMGVRVMTGLLTGWLQRS